MKKDLKWNFVFKKDCGYVNHSYNRFFPSRTISLRGGEVDIIPPSIREDMVSGYKKSRSYPFHSVACSVINALYTARRGFVFLSISSVNEIVANDPNFKWAKVGKPPEIVSSFKEKTKKKVSYGALIEALISSGLIEEVRNASFKKSAIFKVNLETLSEEDFEKHKKEIFENLSESKKKNEISIEKTSQYIKDLATEFAKDGESQAKFAELLKLVKES